MAPAPARAALLLAALASGAAAAGAAAPGSSATTDTTPEPAETRPERPAVRVLRNGGLRAESAALLVSGQQGGELPLAILALPLAGGDGRSSAEQQGGRTRVPVLVEIGGPALLAATPAGLSWVRIEVSLYAIDAAGGVHGAASHTVEIDLRRMGGFLRAGGGLRFAGELLLPPGELSLRVLVRNAATRRVGLAAMSLVVPGGAALAPLLLPPLFLPSAAATGGRSDFLSSVGTSLAQGSLGPAAPPRHAAAWIEARAAGVADPIAGIRGALGAAAPLRLPSARPVLAADGEASFVLPARGLPESGIELSIELRRMAAPATPGTAPAMPAAGGPAVAELPARAVERRAAPGSAGLELIAVAFSPRGQPPGSYELRAVARAPALRVRSPALTLVLAAGDGAAGSREIAEAGAAGAPLSAAHGSASGKDRAAWAGRRHRAATPAFAAAYRAALARLAAGEAHDARAAVFDLELAALRERRASVEELGVVEAGLLRPLGEADPEALVPVLDLYESLYRDAHERRHPQLASHSREMVRSLADFYAARSRSPAAPRLAAALLVRFGSELEAAGGPANGFSRRAFARAVELDGESAPALLCLAIDAERHGDLRGALELLERLRHARPNDAEAQLRLGLVLARLGRPAEARRLLASVTAAAIEGVPPASDDRAARADWLQAVAFQELGRLLLDGGEIEAAEKLLRRGLDRFPGNEKLLLELAVVLEVRRQPEGSGQIVEALQPATAGGGESAEEGGERHRYTALPAALLARTSSGIVPAVAERLPALAQALRQPAREGRR